MPCKVSGSYKATKVISLKKEEESFRCSLEEAVVTAVLRGITRVLKGHPQHCPGVVFVCVCAASVKVVGRTLRTPAPFSHHKVC